MKGFKPEADVLRSLLGKSALAAGSTVNLKGVCGKTRNRSLLMRTIVKTMAVGVEGMEEM